MVLVGVGLAFPSLLICICLSFKTISTLNFLLPVGFVSASLLSLGLFSSPFTPSCFYRLSTLWNRTLLAHLCLGCVRLKLLSITGPHLQPPALPERHLSLDSLQSSPTTQPPAISLTTCRPKGSDLSWPLAAVICSCFSFVFWWQISSVLDFLCLFLCTHC